MSQPAKKRLLSLLLAMALVFSFIGVGIPAYAAEGDEYEFQVLFTSDLHGCFSDWSYSTNSSYTGLARVATKINELRTGKENSTILIDVGDTIQGNGTSVFHTSTWDDEPSNTEKMYPALIGMEYLKYDAWVLGNHEFNFGVDRLEKAYGKDRDGAGQHGFSGAILAGNVFNDGETDFDYGSAVYDSFLVKEFNTGSGTLRVAVIGMTHPNIVNWDAGNLDGVYTTRSASEMTKKTIEYLKSPAYENSNGKIDIFIAAQHMSDTREYGEGSGAEDVIAQCGGDLALFIGAHGHTNQNKLVDGVRYVENGSNGGRLGQVAITVTQQADGSWAVADKTGDDVKMTSHTLSSSATADAAYLADTAIAAADTFAKNYANTKIGELTGGPLVPDAEINGTYQAYLQDTALVHLINDAMIYYANTYIDNDPTLSAAGKTVTLSGTAPLDTNANATPGDLTRGDVSKIYKYDNNTLCIVEMTGAQFKAWMEWAYIFIGPYKGSGYSGFDLGPAMKAGDLTIPYGNGNMPGYNMDQFSGVKYTVDLTKPYGERIAITAYDVAGDGSYSGTFDMNGTYWVAVNNYRADTQLTINADEGSRPAVFPQGTAPATMIAREIDTQLTVGNATISNGEGMLGLMVDYIGRAKNGTIDDYGQAAGTFEPNWRYITPDIDPALRAKAVALVNAGMISIADPNNSYARRAITAADIAPYEYLDIFSFNDFHGTLDQSVSSSNPGAAKFVGAVKDEIAKCLGDTMVLAAGDLYQGSALSNLMKGEPITEMLKLLGVEYSAVGNHEFDWGSDLILEWGDDAGMTFLAANIVLEGTNDQPDFCEPYAIVETDSGLKIGIIGLITPETEHIVTAANVAGLTFEDPVTVATALEPQLRAQGCDAVIALTHLSAYQSGSGITGEAADLANAVPALDAIISGHSHTQVSGYVNGVPIVQARYNGRGLGKLSFIFNNGDLISVTPNYIAVPTGNDASVDSDMAAIVDRYNKELEPILSEVVGLADEDIYGKGTTSGNTPNAPDWFNQLVYDYIERTEGAAYVFVQNYGGYRSTGDIENGGNVTMNYLYTLMPFDNEIVLMDMKGSDLINVLNGVALPGTTLVSAPVISGAYKTGSDWFLADGTQIMNDSTIYKVACNDFMFTGGDNFDFTKGTNIEYSSMPVRDAMADELRYRLTEELGAALTLLYTSQGPLSPEFSPSITEYTIDVPNSVTQLALITSASEAGAEIVITGNSNFAVGNNTVTIKVTSADGQETAEYVITVIRAAGGSSGGGTTRYTVKFDSQGGTPVASVSVEKGKTLSKPADPTREGYTFTGWYTDSAATKAYDFSAQVTGSFTLYAGWKEAGVSPQKPFDDVGGHWAEDYINSLALQGYVSGVGGGKFEPNAQFTRAQFVQILYNAFGNGDTSSPADPFEDTDPSMWYTTALNWAYANGLIQGYSATIFGPDDPILREQMAVLIVRAAEKFSITLPTGEKVTFADDADISDYARDSVYAMRAAEIITGKPGNLFDPGAYTTRGEMTKVVYMLLDLAGKIDSGHKV